MFLTVNQLEEAAPYIGYKRIELILPNFNSTCIKYNINNPYRVAHFLTQILMESNYFRIIQEPGNGIEYENSEVLGNTNNGDGRRFISRGYIKILGKRQYQAYSNQSSVDLVAYPHYSTTPRVAMDIAGWIWKSKNLNDLSDKNDLEAITRSIAGDGIMLRERAELFSRILKVIKSNSSS